MEQEQTPKDLPVPNQAKKVCNISIVFPCIDDNAALDVKKSIDLVIKDIKDKRSNFSIVEM